MAQGETPAWNAMSNGVPKDFSRRRFLEVIGATGVAALTGIPIVERIWAASEIEAVQRDAQGLAHQWVMVFDLRRCDGCRDCIKGCQEQHHLPKTDEWIKVYELVDAQGLHFAMPVLCMQCETAPCVRVCPVRATYHRDDGVIVVDQDVCIGCRMCMAACPYDVRVFNWDKAAAIDERFHADTPEFTVPQQQGTVSKCTMCVHLLEEGSLPSCLTSCSMEAIFVGDLVEDVMTNGRENFVLSQYLRANDAWRFRAELGTKPRVYYVSGHGQDLDY
ncbi:MAG: 4Fe-4S dicluster domain-containing protein [Acidimicrobiia bacterium]|nr:4Fe-4S dicluster domain-containing protein [Acidimicrobiia bacterium]